MGYCNLCVGAIVGGAVGLAALPALGVAIGGAAAGPVVGGAFAAAQAAGWMGPGMAAIYSTLTGAGTRILAGVGAAICTDVCGTVDKHKPNEDL